jgi:integrase/recombinase XerD
MKRLTRVVARQDVRALVKAADRRANRHALSGLTTSQRLTRLRDALMVRLMCVTGVRVGELVSLRVTDVREEERTLNIQGKGSRERLAFVADLPTSRLLARYLKARRGLFADHSALFMTAAGRDVATDGVRHLLRTLGKAAGATCRVTPHMLRHTAATALLENGADLRVVQEFLGHGSIRSTERYTHIARAHFVRVLLRTHPLKRVA